MGSWLLSTSMLGEGLSAEFSVAYCSARFYVEDDLVNAFPTIMRQVFNQSGLSLKTPFLDQYVEDRDQLFKDLCTSSLDRLREKAVPHQSAWR